MSTLSARDAGQTSNVVSGPGSTEAMDLLDSIHMDEKAAAAAAVTAGTEPNGLPTLQPASGLPSVPENKELSPITAVDVPSTSADAHAVRSPTSSSDKALCSTPTAVDVTRQSSRTSETDSIGAVANATATPAPLPSAPTNSSSVHRSIHMASSGWQPSPSAQTTDVFGPTVSTTSSGIESDLSASSNSSDSTMTNSVKPLPGLPMMVPSRDREQVSLPLAAQAGSSATTSQDASVNRILTQVPVQHIPRPIATEANAQTSYASRSDATTTPNTATPRSKRSSAAYEPSPSDAVQALALSPPDSNPSRTLAESNRSSIDDIRRFHAQRAARNLEAVTAGGGRQSVAGAPIDNLSSEMAQMGLPSSSRRGSTGVALASTGGAARHGSMIEPRSRDPTTSRAAEWSAAATPNREQIVASASMRPVTSDSPLPRTNADSGAGRPKASPSRNGNHIEGGSGERAAERSSDRDRERERRSRRTLGDYALGKTLGAGSMGKVKLGVKMGNGEKVAIKIIPRHTSLAAAQHPRSSHQSSGDRGSTHDKPVVPPTASFLAKAAAKDHSKEIRTIREGSLQLLLHHPYVCGMREMMIHPNHYYMVFEYVNGGQMLDYIISHGRLRERAARKFARQIGSALEYCHRNSIVHRDLKIENILISKTGNIKIIDFGLSNLFSPHSQLNTFCGSLYFAAPELLNAKAYTGPEVDVWSFGIVLYVLVCGKVPFDDQSMPALHAKIKKGQVEYPAWLSGECKHILSRMLVTNPALRASLPEILAHPWMTKGYEGAPNAHIPHRQPLRPQSLDQEIIKGMTGFEFGTPEEIEARLVEILTSDAYSQALHAWELRHGLSNGLSVSSADVGGSSPLGRSSTRGSTETKSRSGGKRFSGIDFYRKKISGSSLFGSKDDTSALVGANGALGANGVGQLSGSKEALDPTRGFHPLISIYFLVAEKMEREKLYGHSFFASSNISLNGVTSAATAAPPGILSHPSASSAARLEMDRSSMPTAADIPTEALRIPEVSHIPAASRRDAPVPALPVPPASARSGSTSAQGSAPTPVFESRERSQPLANMTGPPRARAQGDEVEAALRYKGLVPQNTATSAGPGTALPSFGGQAAAAVPNWESSALPKPAADSQQQVKRSLSLSAKSQGGRVMHANEVPLPRTPQNQPVGSPALAFTPQTKRLPSVSPDKRRSYHSGVSPINALSSFTAAGATTTDKTTDHLDSPSAAASVPSTPQSGSALVRRFGSLLGRSPSTPNELDRKRQARMSTGGLGVGSLASAAPARKDNGVLPAQLGQVQESPAMEDEAEAGRLSSPHATIGRAGEVRRAGTVQDQRRASYNPRSTPVATMSRAGGESQAMPIAYARSGDRTGQDLPGFSPTAEPSSWRENDHPDSPTDDNNGGRTVSSPVRGGRVTSTATSAFSSSDHTSSKPIFLKGLFSVQTTTTKSRAMLHADLIRVLDRIGLQYRDVKGGYECVHMPSLDFSAITGSSALGTVVSGRGNARITGTPDDVTASEAGADSASMPSPSTPSATKPRRMGSRISFSSKRDKSSKAGGNGVGDSSSVSDSLNNLGQDGLTSAPRSRASSITAQNPREESAGPSRSAAATQVGTKTGANPTSNAAASAAMALELAVRFEIYVVKVPLLLGVNGLQFRRISGNPCQYQQLARRVLQELKL